MSRFWAAGESSDDDDDDGSAESEVEQERVVRPANRWAAVSDSESSVEGERVVRSAKDRAWDGMKLEVTKLKNSMKINDWTGIQTEFDTLNKMIDKAKMHIMKEGLPRFYVKTLVELEDFLLEALKDKEAQKKMSTSNGRALNRMKLALRRHNKAYEKEMAEYRENPDAEESSSDDSSDDDSSDDDDSDDDSSDDSDSDDDGTSDDSDSDSGEVSEEKEEDAKKKDLVDMDSDEWASSDEEEESSDEEEVAGGELRGRARWLKATNVTTSRRRRERTTDQGRVDSKAEKKRRALEAAEARVGATAQKKTEHTVFGKALDDNLTAEQFDRKLLEVVSYRGRKGTDAKELLVALEVLAERAMLKFDPARELSCLMHLVAAQFDISSRTIDEYMDVPAWRSCHARLDRVVRVLKDNDKLVLGTIGDDDVADIHLAQVGKLKKNNKESGDQQGQEGEDDVLEELAEAAKATVTTNEDGVTIARVVGNVLTFVARLEDEYVKSLQRINPHTQEYVHRLKDEAPLVELAGLAQDYYQRIDDKASAATLALLRIEHMYYKHESIANSVRKAQAYRAKWGDRKDAHPASSSATASAERDASATHPGSWLGVPTVDVEPFDAAAAMKTLCEYVYAHGDSRCRTRALLCDVAHSALHGHFYAARDLLLMSHLQDTAHMSDVETQILYNRAMVFLGLCAFRHGLVYEAHSCLADICSSRVKELLAQGVQSARYSEKNSEQEKAERRRQTPYHMHVNSDLLECCHLTSAMLLEVPNMAMDDAIQRSGVAAPGSSSSRRPVSRHFRKHLDIFNRQVFTGPPENTRDHVLAASKALMVGDWKRCADLVLGLDVWNLIPGENAAAQVKSIVASKIKAEALRAYLFAYSSSYDSLSLPVLCDMFDIDSKTAHSLISKMMINGELKGAWDQPTSTVVLYRLDPTPLQTLALRYAEKAAQLVESNERLLDARAGGFQGKDDKDGGRRWKDDRWSSNKQQQGGGGASSYYSRGRGGGGDWSQRMNSRGRGGGGQRSSNYIGGGDSSQRRRQVSWREQRA